MKAKIIRMTKTKLLYSVYMMEVKGENKPITVFRKQHIEELPKNTIIDVEPNGKWFIFKRVSLENINFEKPDKVQKQLSVPDSKEDNNITNDGHIFTLAAKAVYCYHMNGHDPRNLEQNIVAEQVKSWYDILKGAEKLCVK